ncbi:MAG: cyclic nucleotide-binding domain-containing protein [Pseudomonadota bacterium]
MDNQELIIIKSLEPFSSLSPDRLEEVLKEATVNSFAKGKMVFKRGDNDDASYWLLAGSIDLLDESFNARNLSSGDPDAVHVLDDQNPHVLSGVTTEDSRVLRVRRSVLDDHLNEHEMEEIDDGIDWMSTLLSSPLFEFVPPANIQELFEKFEELRFEKGDVVVTQGEPGDYFYVIRSGRVLVERTNKGKTSVLAELRAGDNFGQDALISDVPRNATVTMTTRGILMRLSEPDFESLLMHPIIETLSINEVQDMIDQGEPQTFILDVRNPDELAQDKIEGSINVPLLLLRPNIGKLKSEAVYVTRCGGIGMRSTLAAYLLNEAGMTAYVLDETSGTESEGAASA